MGVNEAKTAILNNKTALGIEFGSTRIKAVLVDDRYDPIASGMPYLVKSIFAILHLPLFFNRAIYMLASLTSKKWNIPTSHRVNYT